MFFEETTINFLTIMIVSGIVCLLSLSVSFLTRFLSKKFSINKNLFSGYECGFFNDDKNSKSFFDDKISIFPIFLILELLIVFYLYVILFINFEFVLSITKISIFLLLCVIFFGTNIINKLLKF